MHNHPHTAPDQGGSTTADQGAAPADQVTGTTPTDQGTGGAEVSAGKRERVAACTLASD